MVITVSTRAAAGTYQDESGPVIVRGLQQMGFETRGPQIVPDGEPVAQALRDACAGHYDVIITTGGTGLNPFDQTPQMTSRVISYEVPGIAEAIRMENFDKVPTSILSRGIAGVAITQDSHWTYRSLIVNLPGSPGGAQDGITVLAKVLPHVVSQLQGGDHARGGGFGGAGGAGGFGGGPQQAPPGGGYQGGYGAGGGYQGGGGGGGYQGGGGYGGAQQPPWGTR
ncbi:MogA/MoaB family molybdenum cofactor biosynthesis protein [Embleya sp. NPDC055664]|uniref:MogA/MoaB family molybdenum cofactor biosynthesis protein n=1 Tax=Embleya sp. NPDC059237 TaxID=3346784 RepID=UPI003677E31D